MHAVLALGHVPLGEQIADRGAVLQREEGVAQTFPDIHRAAVHGVESYGVPPAEGRGPDPDVDHDVEPGPAGARHVLRLPGRHVGEVHAAQHTTRRHRRVALRQQQRVSNRGRDPVGAVPLEEHAACVAVLPRRDLVRARDRQLSDLHQAEPSERRRPRRGPSRAGCPRG